jgi:hypothetical protein
MATFTRLVTTITNVFLYGLLSFRNVTELCVIMVIRYRTALSVYAYRTMVQLKYLTTVWAMTYSVH